MKRIINNNKLFLMLFLLALLINPIYRLINIKRNIYTVATCKYLEDDYNKLLEFNNIDMIYDSEYINTFIIYKDIYNYLNEITIRGGKDIELDKYPVIYDNTLIGTIDKIYESTSTVKLVTNKSQKISVVINNNIGVLENVNGKLIVRNISSKETIKKNDMVYTSGLGNIKDNIYIGLVKNVEIDNKSLEYIIEIDYSINIKDIDYVTIIKDSI